MDRWQAMRVFVRVAETASFAATARQLHLSAPSVTRAVAALEEEIGARLLVRTTRSVKLTEAGRGYFDDCRRILADIAEAEAAAAGSYATPTGTLAVTAPAMFGRRHVLPILTEFLDAHPTVTGRALFIDRPVNLVEEGIDVAVRIGHLPDSPLAAIRVGRVRRVLCASPSYLARRRAPKTPADLKNHRIIASTSAWSSPEWRFARGARVMIAPALLSNDNESAIAAAAEGWGLTRALHYQIAPEVARGELRIVLADHEEPPLPIHLLHPESTHAPAKVRSFLDLAVKRLRATRILND